MARGVLSGIGLGAVFSIGMAGVISVLVPIESTRAPETGKAGNVAPSTAPATQAPVTAGGSQDTRQQPQITMRPPTDEPAPAEPAASAQAPEVSAQAPAGADGTTPDHSPASLPATEPDSRAPAPVQPGETTVVDDLPEPPAPLPQPETGPAGTLTAPRPLPDSVVAMLEADAPVLPNPQALAPMIPDDAPEVQVSPQAIANPAAAPIPTPQDAPDTIETAPTERPRVLPAPDGEGAVNTNRPRIGTPANTLTDRSAADAPLETDTSDVATDPSMQQPIRRYGEAFGNPDGKPLMSILLIDAGAVLDAGGIGLPALGSFPYPLSFAVDASLPDARARMERYRAEGFEVLAMVNLPQGARPSDAEVSLAAALDDLPQVVGLLDGTGEGLQGSREVADQVTAILKSAGLGLVAQSKGLDSMPKLAVKKGVPAAPVFRDFDSKNQDARVIRRFLDQAAFKAGQEGSVIMQGRLRSETIEALLVWGLADRASTVALAPISATLLAQQ